MTTPPNPEMDSFSPIGCVIALLLFFAVDAVIFFVAWHGILYGY